ncbi:TolC family protein [Paludibacterium denitrificans]|uniref:TolC family protein n=1 Tax=Paludibacterium denitrificans TaxID=2675226 RepID=UPI001E5DE751|nr:TolC family protein [Paludibacterium denitrificans]
MDASPQGPWWTVYGDSQLNALMDELNRQSPTLAAAEAQYRLAQAQLRQAESGLFPSLSATAGRTRGTQSSGSDSVSNQYSLGLAASWEIDLWGRVRRAVEAGQAKQAADLAQLHAVRLSSQAQLASAGCNWWWPTGNWRNCRIVHARWPKP